MAGEDFPQVGDPRIAWAAGLFEGEGCVGYTRSQDRWQLIIESTDLDVLRTFHEVVQVGSISGPKKKPKSSHKVAWRWTCGAVDDVTFLLELLLPWLHARRRGRAQEALSGIRSRRKGKHRTWETRGECRRGHDITDPDNVTVESDGTRHCAVCRAEAADARKVS